MPVDPKREDFVELDPELNAALRSLGTATQNTQNSGLV